MPEAGCSSPSKGQRECAGDSIKRRRHSTDKSKRSGSAERSSRHADALPQRADPLVPELASRAEVSQAADKRRTNHGRTPTSENVTTQNTAIDGSLDGSSSSGDEGGPLPKACATNLDNKRSGSEGSDSDDDSLGRSTQVIHATALTLCFIGNM